MSKTSIIIASAARREMALRLLGNLASQTILPDEIILVEGGSAQWCNEDAPLVLRDRFVVLYAPQGGLSISRDKGQKAAHGDILFFFDDDIIIPPTYLADAVVYLNTHSNVMGVGGIYIDTATSSRSKASILIGRIFGIYANGSCNKILKSGWADYVRPPFSRAVTCAQWLFGCNAVIRAKAFDNPSINFETKMAAWSFLEDIFFGACLTKEYGNCLCILPSLEVIHAPPNSIGQISKITLRMRILYRYIFWRDHISEFYRKSLSSFILGMTANLLLMLKQERALWVLTESIKTYTFMFNAQKIGWREVNEFIFSQH